MDGEEKARVSGRRSIHDSLSRSISRSLSRAGRNMEDMFSVGRNSRRTDLVDEDEEALKWAAIEKLPTYNRLRTSIIQYFVESDQVQGNKLLPLHKEVDVRKLDMNERKFFIDKLFNVAEEDTEKFLERFRRRVDKVGIRLPTTEVRFEHLTIEADCHVGTRALPSLPNAARNIAESALGMVGIDLSERTKLTILKEASGVIKPSRMALLLGPPSSGKTTLLLALAGKLDPSLKVRDKNVKGDITYNGYRLDEFVPRKSSAYISQNDVHIGEMTVRETLDFSARCQGVGTRYDLLSELARREKDAGIFPEAEVDLFMKATAMEGVESSLITDYTLKILGLDICKDTVVGDEMIRGISGGQKKRVTTGEMLVGPTKTLFMDEISTGLDSSTTYQIVKCLQHIVHHTEATVMVSLLQPAPETFDLFDDIIFLSEGQIVYQGPREHVLAFFESCGFRCPERKGAADFLQEVTSSKDQEQYWVDRRKPYRFIAVPEFAERFRRFHVGIRIENELSVPFDKSRGHKAALSFSKYSAPTIELLKACWDREWMLVRRNAFVYVAKTVQIIIMAVIVSTLFMKSRMHTRNEEDGTVFIGALLFTIIINIFNGLAELTLVIKRLPVFYKQRELQFHPAWTFTLPTFLLQLPTSIIESVVWVSITYYSIGFAPEASRFFKQLLLVFLIQQMAAGLFRLIAGVCRTMIIANTGGALTLLLVFLLGGFILPQGTIPNWWEWGYWLSPLSYAYKAIAVNEMFAPRWMNKLASDNATRLGTAVLHSLEVSTDKNWYWIGTAAILGFAVLFNVLFTFSLEYFSPPGKPQAIISEETTNQGTQSKRGSPPQSEASSDGNSTSKIEILRMSSPSNPNGLVKTSDSTLEAANGVAPKRGMVVPFTPLSMSFEDVNYFVDMPPEMTEQGISGDRLQLLREVTGAFRPGVLTALMGVSGAGKTTLMDVLARRKTGGYIDGDIRISGFPKKQETFARISGYCEQNDIHSPQVTVKESLIYSAFLRLPKEVSKQEKMIFVDEVTELVELDNLKDAIVGLPGITGLSTEQRKRLTIAVELVANPSIIFMDEPTSGLDAKAAAIVMRTVRNTMDTGRTVVCTIHQPSIDIFEAFDELLLMKRGGQVIYSGTLGRNSHKIIEYFESEIMDHGILQAIHGIPKIKEKYNPATWMLEVSSVAAEVRLGMDFAEHYKCSSLYQYVKFKLDPFSHMSRRNKALVKEVSTQNPGAKDLYFSTQYSESIWGQFKSCLWKQWWTYWRTPDYNLVRGIFTLFCALMVGSIFWNAGTKRESSSDLSMIIGAMYSSVLFVGINNCQTVQPVVAVERTVFYREKAVGMYSALPYAIAQRIPRWWVWYYWICPVAWTVYGLIVSQYGDVQDTIKVPGYDYNPQIKFYIQDHFGYDPDFMGPVAVVLVGFTLFFAFLFAFCIRTLNFQTR
uniref:ABC transporter domain-containing protein n=1 Tax=Salix viminalis TaxID=40686 RepID=A0A6N2N8C3_SALVM